MKADVLPSDFNLPNMFPSKFSPKYLVLLVVLAAVACNPLKRFDDFAWKPAYLGPLAFVTFDPIEIAEVAEKVGRYQFRAADANIPGFAYNMPVTIPPFSGVDLPKKYTELLDIFAEISVIECRARVYFENKLPITVSAGTTIVGRDSSSGDLMWQHAFTRDVPPGDIYEGTESIFNKKLTSDLEMQVINFGSPGGNQVVFQDVELEVAVFIDVLRLERALVRPDKQYDLVIDTRLEVDLGETGQDSDAEGYLSLFFENTLPASASLTIELWDDNQNVIYSFFGPNPYEIDAPPVDANGVVTGIVESKLVNHFDIKDLPNLEQARYIYSSTVFHTLTHPIDLTVKEENYLKIILSADITGTVVSGSNQ